MFLNFWSIDILSVSNEQVKQSDIYAGWLFFIVRKVIVHILN